MARGRIKWFNANKGYGFIEADHGARDIFVHASAVRDSGLDDLEADQRVEFEIHQLGDGRTVAQGLRLMQPEEPDTPEPVGSLDGDSQAGADPAS